MPEIPSLKNPKMKVHRARFHAHELDRLAREWFEKNPTVATGESYPDFGKFLIRFKMSMAPMDLGLILGDLLYCLRSALDQLAWQLALLTTATPFDRTEFPIFAETSRLERLDSVTRNIPSDARRIIRGLQPFQMGSAYRRHRLWQLDKLCNTDKHRIMTMRGMNATFRMQGNPDEVTPVKLGPFEVGFMMPITWADRDVLDLSTSIAIGADEIAPSLSALDLGAIIDAVDYGVLSKFEKFFKDESEDQPPAESPQRPATR